jgi:hypothetical protein
MAVLIGTQLDGTEIKPASGKFSLKEMQEAVGGYIEVYKLWRTHDKELFSGERLRVDLLDKMGVDIERDSWLVIDEEGKLKKKAINWLATQLYVRAYGPFDFIVGSALWIPRSEMEEE